MDNQQNDDQLVQNMRFYGELRFKQFTLFLAWLTLVGIAFIQGGDKYIFNCTQLKFVLAIASMLVTGVIWTMEISSTLYWCAHRDMCPDMWPGKKSEMGFISSTNAVLILYVCNYIFWLVCAFKWDGNCYWIISFGLLGTMLLTFTIWNYIKYVWFKSKNKDRDKDKDK